MRSSGLIYLALACSVCAVSCSSQPAALVPSGVLRASVAGVTDAVELKYSVTTLPASFFPVAMNNSAAIAGESGEGPAVYHGGSLTQLATSGFVTGMNDRDDVVGDGTGGPTLWRDGTALSLASPSPPEETNVTGQINDRGQIDGIIDGNSNFGDGELSGNVVFLSPSSPPVSLGLGTNGIPLSINDKGQVAGFLRSTPQGPYENTAFLYGGAKGCTSSATNGAYNSEDFGLTNRGHVIEQFNNGTYLFCRNSKAVVLSGTPIADDNEDFIVGTESGSGGAADAFIRAPRGKYYDLNTVVPAGTPHLQSAFAINDRGDILAEAASASSSNGFVYLLLRPDGPRCESLFRT